MTDDKNGSNRLYINCPICGAILLQAQIVKDGIIKCERCHKRSWIEIHEGKVTAIPINKKDK